MSASAVLRSAIAMSGKKMSDISEYLGMSQSALAMRFSRDTWPAAEFSKIIEFCGAKVFVVFPDGTQLYLPPDPEPDVPAPKPRSKSKSSDTPDIPPDL